MISSSRLAELLTRYKCSSVVDPHMGVPFHLNYLKRHGFTVHGADVVAWFVRAAEGLVANDFTILEEKDLAQIVEMVPGHMYVTDRFKAWEGVFFTEEQCAYLSVWHDNVRRLRSDGQTGLAVLGLWNVLCYWLQKTEFPDDMPDIPASELAWTYLMQMDRWVGSNARYNTAAQNGVLETIAAHQADALFVSLPKPHAFRSVDARVWMWEAWWHGNPYYTIEDAYRGSLFGERAIDEEGYARAVASVLSSARHYPLVIFHVDRAQRAQVEPLLRNARAQVHDYPAVSGEVYLAATNPLR